MRQFATVYSYFKQIMSLKLSEIARNSISFFLKSLQTFENGRQIQKCIDILDLSMIVWTQIVEKWMLDVAVLHFSWISVQPELTNCPTKIKFEFKVPSVQKINLFVDLCNCKNGRWRRFLEVRVQIQAPTFMKIYKIKILKRIPVFSEISGFLIFSTVQSSPWHAEFVSSSSEVVYCTEDGQEAFPKLSQQRHVCSCWRRKVLSWHFVFYQWSRPQFLSPFSELCATFTGRAFTLSNGWWSHSSKERAVEAL